MLDTMAVVDKLAMLNIMAMVITQDDPMIHPQLSNSRSKNAADLIARHFESHGWEVQVPHAKSSGGADLIVHKSAHRYVVQIKALAEGRADRVIPLLSQAILEAQAQARDEGNAQPLAVICVENASAALLNQVLSFSQKYAPNVPIGIVSVSGTRNFYGQALEELNAEPEQPRWNGHPAVNHAVNLFSDLSQWMLKVLLAPDIPIDLLSAPRNPYQGGSDLALAAQVSSMSASRFLQQLRNDGFLDASSRHLVLVRRAELLRRWRSAVMRPSPELPMRFLIRGNLQQQIRGLLASQEGEACLGLFAAADALQIGHVSGVPPYVYVPKLPRPGAQKSKSLIVVSPSEVPDLILRQAPYPKSILRGAVHRDGATVSDVIQVWLDVSNHPSRGQEQAELIYQKLLLPMINKGQ
jgi:hypothetical protein